MGRRDVVKIVTAIFEMLRKPVAVFTPKSFQKRCTRFRNIGASQRLIVAQTLRGCLRVTTKIGVRFDRGAVGMERVNIRRYRTAVFIAWIPANAIKHRSEPKRTQRLLILN